MAARARGEGKTPHRQFRLEDDLWSRFQEAVKQLDSDRSTELRGFVMWFVREPGAKMPKRPQVAVVDGGDAESPSGSPEQEA